MVRSKSAPASLLAARSESLALFLQLRVLSEKQVLAGVLAGCETDREEVTACRQHLWV